jgi:hypothetical protein
MKQNASTVMPRRANSDASMPLKTEMRRSPTGQRGGPFAPREMELQQAAS